MVNIAETNDLQAHDMSLPDPYVKKSSVSMLDGSRFPFVANQVYRMPSDKWQAIKDNPEAVKPIIQWFVKDHYVNQLPRILTLERYYQGDNDIHYWNSEKASDRADNRIANGLGRYITDIRVGYQFGNPLKFGYSNLVDNNDTGDDLINQIELFNSKNDETYHEKVMGKNLNNTGRAYELLYVRQDTNEPAIKAIDPANCLVVYDTTIEQHSLFAVRYYMVNFMDQVVYYVEVYTDEKVYYFTSDDSPIGNYNLTDQQEHYFQSVPINEYQLNDDRLGSWEIKLDEFDALDKSISEMANSQEDFGNAILVVSGDVSSDDDDAEPLLDASGNQMYDEDGHKLYKVSRIDPTQRVMFLTPSMIANNNGGNTVVPTTAEYLTKELGSEGWQMFNSQLLADIHKDTNTPDVTDENFAANASGVAMSYKLWGSDQERATQQSLYTRGLMRRLRLLATYWGFISLISNPDEVENVQITYTPNLPKNNAELVTNFQALAQSEQISSETLHEYIEPVTGITADQEAERLKKQTVTNSGNTSDLFINALQKAGINVDNNFEGETADSTTS